MGKKKKRSRKELLKRASGYQNQYNLHQEKMIENPNSPAVSHWKKEKKNFLARINYYLACAKVRDFDTV